ncbi:MAG: class I SAM-dependent methyltransferase [Planctomycetota bacterium]|nr:class I SAM-dependent methyltransferase [Planctomycetota bacterium]
MNLKAFLSRMLPAAWLQKLLLNREHRSLNQLPVVPCKTDGLLENSAFSDNGIFTSTVIQQDWQQVSEQLSRFEIPDMTGGVNPGDRRAIFFLTRGLGARSVLEIGTHIGASTCHFAAAIEQNMTQNANPSSGSPRLVSVDVADVNCPTSRPWLAHGSKHSPAEMIAALGCEKFVEFQTCRSLEFMQSENRSYDLIFLDGDHSAKTTYREIPAAMNLLSPGGVILLHDFFPQLKPLWSNGSVIPGPQLAVQRLIGETPQVQVLPLGNLPWPTKLGSHRTSLALLLKTAASVDRAADYSDQ